MSTHSSKRRSAPRNRGVPRDQPTDDKIPAEITPSAATSNPKDEEYTDAGKPLVADSPEARALHENPPRSEGGLGVGTAGDAARPTKSGLHDKPVPPRQSM